MTRFVIVVVSIDAIIIITIIIIIITSISSLLFDGGENHKPASQPCLVVGVERREATKSAILLVV
jgi:hypothetical protein